MDNPYLIVVLAFMVFAYLLDLIVETLNVKNMSPKIPPEFEGLYDDPDPILGIKDTRNKNSTHEFTILARPVRRKVRGLGRFVHVVGGAYFFMPGLRALEFLAQITQR